MGGETANPDGEGSASLPNNASTAVTQYPASEPDLKDSDASAPEAVNAPAKTSLATAPVVATNMASHAPIRMKLVANNNRKSRKRKQRPNAATGGIVTNPAAAGMSSSNESSEDEDDDKQSSTKKANQQGQPDSSAADAGISDKPIAGQTVETENVAPENKKEENEAANRNKEVVASQNDPAVDNDPSTKEDPQRQGPPPEQPDGWRVKLYRLNLDGSWDDCGTGRIVCLYRSQPSPPPPPQSQHPLHNNKNPQESDNQHENLNDNSHQQQQEPHSARPGPHQTTDQWLYQETGEATLCVQAELTKTNRQVRVLLRTRILLREPYQRQGDNIITWCEPFYGQQHQQQQHPEPRRDEGDVMNGAGDMQPPGGGVDLALSFQDNAGCLDIWRQITQVQSRAAELLRSLPNDDSVQRMAAAIAAQHHAQMQPGVNGGGDQQHQPDMVVWGGGHLHEDGSPGGAGGNAGEYILESPVHLPDPPTLANLEQIADTIAAIHNVQQREAMANVIAKEECAYLRLLLALFPSAEERNDYGKLATLAACVKTVLLLNEPSILELIVTVAEMFEQVCSCLEYDPDLREKANHRWFLRERAKFRTVVAMDNLDLVAAIHRSFRVNFLRDTLLRPTMDESSLSTLSSLQTFSHADVVKGVTMSPNGEEVSLTESYLVRVIRMLGIELHAICVLEWMELDNPSVDTSKTAESHDDLLSGASDPSIVVGENPLGGSTTWKQYLAPQDASLASRRLRRRGCLNFLRELFNMVRLSLQQNDKDDFFSVISTLDVDLVDDVSDNISQTSQIAEVGSVASTVKSEQTGAHVEIPHPSSPVSLLSLLGNALADPNLDASEIGAALEIVSGVAMHDPSFIRRHCIEYHNAQRDKGKEPDGANRVAGRPNPNEKKQVIDITPPNDLLASLLFLLDVTTDAGILLQATEIMRIILDTDIVGDNGSISAGFKDEAEGVPLSHPNGPHHDQHTQPSQAAVTTNDQKQFFSLFYEHYMEWLVAPFQFSLLHPIRRVPENVSKNPADSKTMQAILSSWRSGTREDDRFLRTVPFDAIRSSFAVELLSFCVRAHLYRMKFFLLKSRVLGNVLALLRPNLRYRELSGDRCLKLAALRFLRSILSVHDEFYHRHIIQHDLFAPVFAALRENPVGDNLVSSSIVEMCDYIHNENIKSLIEYIVTKHLSAEHSENETPRLEDVSSPYVSTLTVLREAYETNRNNNQMQQMQGGLNDGQMSPGGSRYFPPSGSAPHHPVSRVLSGKALEDQRKFQEADEEESYFESDTSAEANLAKSPEQPKSPAAPTNASLSVPMAVDEVDAAAVAGTGDGDLHRTPRMFSLAQAPLLNHLDEAKSPPMMAEAIQNRQDGGASESPPSIDAPATTDVMEEESVATVKSEEMDQDKK